MIPFANHITWQQTTLIESIFIYFFEFFFRRKANEIQIGIVWLLKFQSQITVITMRKKHSLFFYFDPQLLDRTQNFIWKIDIVCKTYHANKFCVVWSLFLSVRECVFGLWFVLNWMGNDSNIYTNRRFRIDLILWIFSLSLSFFIYILSIPNKIMYSYVGRTRVIHNDATAQYVQKRTSKSTVRIKRTTLL